jgi:hypothetical protein
LTDIPADCLDKHRKPEFEVKEHRSVVIFGNPGLRAILQITIDDCVLKEGERCDWLIIVNGNDLSILVELKGSDIDKAYRQLKTSHQKLTEHLKRHKTWIVSYSGSPRFNTTIQNLTLRARKDHGSRLLVENSPYLHVL